MMTWVALQSSHLKQAGYDPDTGVLAIEFQNGSVYHAPHADIADLHRLRAARSAGEYFHRHIKFKYRIKKVK